MGVGSHLGSENQHDYLFFCSCPLVLWMSNPSQACCRNMERSVIESYQVWHCMKSLFRKGASFMEDSAAVESWSWQERQLRDPFNQDNAVPKDATSKFLPFPWQQMEWWALEFSLFLVFLICVVPVLCTGNFLVRHLQMQERPLSEWVRCRDCALDN